MWVTPLFATTLRSPHLNTVGSGKETWKELEVQLLNCVRLFATPQTVAYQASLSIGFSRQ